MLFSTPGLSYIFEFFVLQKYDLVEQLKSFKKRVHKIALKKWNFEAHRDLHNLDYELQFLVPL